MAVYLEYEKQAVKDELLKMPVSDLCRVIDAAIMIITENRNKVIYDVEYSRRQPSAL